MRVKILPGVAEVRDGVSRYTASLVAALRMLDVEIVAQDDNYDVLHLVAAHRYDPEWREAKRRGKRLVVTVHDLIPEHFSLTGPQYDGVVERREILEAADMIIAVSQYTKDDIVATYRIPAAKIHVIYNGVDQPPSSSPSSSPSPSPSSSSSPSSSPFLLWVGRRAGYKNFFWFVCAVAPLLWKNEWRVICTGGHAFGRRERLLMAILGVSRRFKVVQADEMQMTKLYREAICLVMPSEMEGFGLPLIEAMANGCPVVAPYAHVFPEVAGDAAAYFDPNDGRRMRQKIFQCLDSSERKWFIMRGKEQAGMYSWGKCAELVRVVYLSVLQ